ncbi:MAG: DUF1559 domain-containing protein, partial [bacterium]|nr:DUF1559 domain-containing protein [bacterium]
FLMAPGSTAAAGKTTYLGVYGDSFIFSKPKGDGRKGNGMRDVTDGTSNTIMIVEASDESAVIWTKPDDFTPDAMNPWSGLIGLRKEGFLAGFTDGSVSIINKNDNNKGLMALFTRNGGEPVSRWDFEFGADEIPDFGPEPDFIEEPDFGEEPRFEESVPEFSPDRAVPE